MKKTIFILTTIFAFCILFTGCAIKHVTLTSTFDAVLTEKMLEPGNNTINGSALIRQRNGGVVTCAGREVLLFPATIYAKERMNAIYNNTVRGYKSAGLGSERVQFDLTPSGYIHSRRSKIGDAQGYFSFHNIKDGSYFVVTSILWQTSANDIFYQGGVLMQYVEVSDGETKNIVLAP